MAEIHHGQMRKSKNQFLKITPIIHNSQDRNNNDLFNKFQSVQVHLKRTIEESKHKYYTRLSDRLLEK